MVGIHRPEKPVEALPQGDMALSTPRKGGLPVSASLMPPWGALSVAAPSELAFQGEMGLDGLHSPGAPAASLVPTTHNSPREHNSEDYCPAARMVDGGCDEHGQRRWVLVPCKRRSCDVCGPNGRYRIAKRIAWGVREMPCRSCGHKMDGCWAHGQRRGIVDCSCKGMILSAAWMVLTFANEIAEQSEWKPKAVKKLEKFIAWLRGSKGLSDLQYFATYELTKRGRLHINLVLGPWKEIPQAELQDRWGARVSVAWVRDDAAIANETAKSYSPESLGTYLAKLKQSVPEEWGRRYSCSKDWPKLPPYAQRRGAITWIQEWDQPASILTKFLIERDQGLWEEVRIGEWARKGAPRCDCFDLVPVEDSG